MQAKIEQVDNGFIVTVDSHSQYGRLVKVVQTTSHNDAIAALTRVVDDLVSKDAIRSPSSNV